MPLGAHVIAPGGRRDFHGGPMLLPLWSHVISPGPLLLLPSIFPRVRVFSNESALCIRWPKYWSFSFSIIPSKEIPGLISFRMPGAITWAPRENHVGPHGQSRGPPGEITRAPRGNHVGPQGQSSGPPGEITWAPRSNHVGPHGKSPGPPGEITWAPMGNHVCPQGKSGGPPWAITWAPRGNHVGPQGQSRGINRYSYYCHCVNKATESQKS